MTCALTYMLNVFLIASHCLDAAIGSGRQRRANDFSLPLSAEDARFLLGSASFFGCWACFEALGPARPCGFAFAFAFAFALICLPAFVAAFALAVFPGLLLLLGEGFGSGALDVSFCSAPLPSWAVASKPAWHLRSFGGTFPLLALHSFLKGSFAQEFQEEWPFLHGHAHLAHGHGPLYLCRGRLRHQVCHQLWCRFCHDRGPSPCPSCHPLWQTAATSSASPQKAALQENP